MEHFYLTIKQTIQCCLVSAFSFALLSACQESMPSELHTPDIDIRTINGLNYAYYKGEPYTGNVYSSDEKHMMVIKNGMGTKAITNIGVEEEKPDPNRDMTKPMVIPERTITHSLKEIEEEYKKWQYIADDTHGDFGKKFAAKMMASSAKHDFDCMKMLPNCSFTQ